MAHFAELDENNIVTRVIVVHNNELMDGETESEVKGVSFCASLFGHTNWIQTSYNNMRTSYKDNHNIDCSISLRVHRLYLTLRPLPVEQWYIVPFFVS